MSENASSREEVRDFLQGVKAIISERASRWRTWVIVRRPKNIAFVAELGFNYSDIRDTILDLSVEDYCEGPVQDRDERGRLWVFGKVIAGKETYIKLKVAELSILKVVRVVSFHEADQPLGYPFK